ncbi:hypothetical protein K1W54_06675 [Micromonospora sp. CPCC 205371]|nr:hypothetical protein [Micromonospora sp. CPCC 205371]
MQSIDGELERLEMTSIKFPAYRGETVPKYIEKVQTEDSDRSVIRDSRRL